MTQGTKTLYGILGIGTAATPEQIEAAYTQQVAALGGESADLGSDGRNQMIAVREAYKTLSNPPLRQIYDQKLASPNFDRRCEILAGTSAYADEMEGTGAAMKVILLVGAIGVAGVLLYNSNDKERERLRIAREHAVRAKAGEIEQERQRQTDKAQNAVVETSPIDLQQRRSDQ